MMYCNKTVTIDQYLRKLSGQDKELQNLDHNYVKYWSAHPDSHRTKPARMLFMNTSQRYARVVDDEEIDVLTPEKKVSYGPSPFDSQKSKSLANELERSLKCNPQIFDVDREESEDILKSCSYQQRRIYQHVIQVLNDAMLAKSVYAGHPHESIKRKIATEKCARRLRLVFANNFYDFDLINWIHKMILDKSDFETIVSYLYLLQALRAKIPTLVDKIVQSYSGYYEFLTQILKKQFDPVAPLLNQIKPRKLSSNPFLLMTCAGFDLQKADHSSRFQFWVSHLNALCKTIHVPVVSDDGAPPKTIKNMADVAVSLMKQKISELRNHFPHRPIILAGWTIGALIACQIALEMPVDAVLCFGFPLTGVNGSRGDLDDPLLISNKPTLFIVGQNANMCSTDDMEDFRSRMSGETGLVVIGGADDFLRVSPRKMMEECITQNMVDRCILDEINDFLQAALMKLPSTSTVVSANSLKSCPTILEESPDMSDQEDDRKRKRRKPKEYSPELQSSRKRPRHSISKEIPSVPLKSRFSPSSSETSSSGSFKFEKPNMMKSVKKSPEKKRVGRPPSGASRKKPISKPVKPILKHFIKPIIKPLIKPAGKAEIASPIKITLKQDTLVPISVSPPKQLSSIEAKPSVPFALNILPKRNDPVDVELAFGKDSIFLPRPLTPPELEDANASEATGKVHTEPKLPVSTPAPSAIQNISPLNPQPQSVSSGEKSIISLIEQPSVAAASSKTSCGSIIKPIINTSDSKKGIAVSVASPSFKVFQQGKVVNTSPVAQLKNVSRVKLIGSSLSQASTVNTSKTLITVPTNSTILVSGSTLKTHSGKVLKLLSKGPVALKKKDSPTSPSGSIGSAEPSEQQVCNLSLLSDVAGMTEPLKDSRKAEPSSSSATLVKLAVPDKSQHLKQFQVLKSFQTRPLTTRIDTPEEMAEKQLAIQALNKSIGVDNFTQPAKESDYSICFTKPDGSILSRAVPRTSHTTYIRQSLLPQQSSRGRQRPVLPSKTYQFYHK